MLDRQPPRTAVVVPCFNDWASLTRLLAEIDEMFAATHHSRVIVVDDGSITPIPAGITDHSFQHLERLDLVSLGANMGHQRALCIGLTVALEDPSIERVALMDSDGEDRPQDLQHLASALTEGTGAVVAQRGRRSEGTAFRFFNVLFRWLFRLFTGERLDFGNFAILDRPTATRLAYMTDTWNNVPTSLMRSKAVVTRLATDRGARYEGRSKMGFVGLVNHGLGAIATFADVVFARLIVVASVAFGGTVLIGVSALIVRLSTGQPLPGWFALGTTALAIASLLVLIFLTLLTFVMLAQRRQTSLPPIVAAQDFIVSRYTLFPHTQGTDSGR